MGSTFRASTAAQAEELAEFCERILEVSDSSPVFSPANMAWKYWVPWSSWEGSRSFVLMRDARLVAHAAVWPLLGHIAGRTVRFVQVYDWAADPSAVGAGAALLTRIASQVDGVLTVGGSQHTQRMVGPLGFRAFGQARRYVMKAEAVRRATAGAAGFDVVRPELPSAPLPGDPSELRFVRTRPMLDDLERCPVARIEWGEVRAGDEALGGFVLSRVPGQARIVDAWLVSTDPRAWSSLMGAAARAASAHDDVIEVVCQAACVPQEQALSALGFACCGRDAVFVRATRELLPDAASLRFQLLDSDLSFLHQGVFDAWGALASGSAQ